MKSPRNFRTTQSHGTGQIGGAGYEREECGDYLFAGLALTKALTLNANGQVDSSHRQYRAGGGEAAEGGLSARLWEPPVATVRAAWLRIAGQAPIILCFVAENLAPGT